MTKIEEKKERIRDKVGTIRLKLFFVLCLTTFSLIFFTILINNVVYEQYSRYSKIQEAKEIVYMLEKYYNDDAEYDIYVEVRARELKKNIQVFVEDDEQKEVYIGNNDVISSVQEYKNNSDKTLTTRVTIVSNSTSPRYDLVISKLSNGYTVYIKVAYTPIRENARTANITLILIGVGMLIISAFIAYYISKKFTKPILEMNKITKKMAKLDFSEKYKVMNADDEVNELGQNINEMSDKLEATIEQLRKNNNQLERDIAEKSKIDEMRKRFISDVSHELKTPIGLIQGYAEGLADNVNDDPESREFYCEVIIDEANKMDKMVKQLLELMKLEYKERQFNDTIFDLNEVINEEIRRETVVIKEKNITIEFNDDEPCEVCADQEYIEQVVTNYMTNAIKHCETVNDEKVISIRTEKTAAGKVRLYVFNTGEKIEEDKIGKIWDRFYKVDSSRNREVGGTGIGLALVKAIMNNYNNEYGVTNLENGVEFFCDLNV